MAALMHGTRSLCTFLRWVKLPIDEVIFWSVFTKEDAFTLSMRVEASSLIKNSPHCFGTSSC